jgi:aspartate aminotransferase/aminotransferase
MKALAERPRTMRYSGIRRMMELAAGRPEVIHLEAGEPEPTTPEHIIEAAATAARAGFTKYTSSAGLPSLREALARKVRERNGLPAGPEQIVVTAGSVFALAAAMLATVDPDDEVLVPDPGWPNYTSLLQLIGARVVPYPLRRDRGYVPDLAALAGLVTARTKLMLLNTPGNPTGGVFARDTVERLMEFANAHDLYVISDEVYEDFVFDGEHVPAASYDHDGRVITIFSFSKSYAMTGWRVGYAVADAEIAALMGRLAEPFVSCPPSVAQKAAEAALAGPQEPVARMRDQLREHRDLVVELLGPAGLLTAVPRGAFYALVDLSALGGDSSKLAEQLLDEEAVATAPGETFGAEAAGTVRISFATERARLQEGCRRIVRFVDRRRMGE